LLQEWISWALMDSISGGIVISVRAGISRYCPLLLIYPAINHSFFREIFSFF
jgi:hypothetical protein